jgi:type II secretory pathway pseudopilin PulG
MKIGQPLRQLQNELWNQKRRNRGSSIVIVIIAMAMIGILATTLLWMSYINYKIKVNDIRNKNSFYSAEMVMEQIVAGLQKEASDSVAVAYQEVLSNWDDLQSESNRYSSFASTYLDTLVKHLRDADKGDGYYKRDILKGYVDTTVWDHVNQTAWDNGTDDTDETKKKPPVMELVNGNSLILRNVFVSYMDGDRLSIVSTDLCLDVPEIVFTQSGSIDELYNYILIGNQGISLKESSGQVTADGSIYAGTDDKGKGGITINKASTLAINNGRYVISKGEIDVIGPGAGLIVRDVKETGSSVYAKNLDLQSGTISFDSKTYIANDLTLSGNGSKATLTKEYYGYGISTESGIGDSKTDQENSSAIIINGQNSTVNMSGVNTLMLAGRAYIGTNTTKKELDQNAEAVANGDAAKKNEKAVLMGESITVKGGQIAYLVPTECLGVYNGETLIGQNPVTQDVAAKIQTYKNDYGENFKEIDFTRAVSRLGGLSLSSFGVTDMDHIRKVSTQYVGGGTESKSLTYYYLVMDAENAAKYYQTYYRNGSNKETIDQYFKKYATGGIVLGDYTSEQNSYTILGNALVSDVLSQSGVSLLASTATASNTMTMAEAYQKSGEIANVYKGLTTNLSEDGASASSFQNVFDSVIKKEIVTKNADGSETRETIQEYLIHNGTGSTMEFTTDDGLKGIITAGNYALSSATSGASNIRLIVSLGDITIDRNFTGLAIAKGTITINGAVSNGTASLKRNKMDLYKVLNATTGAEGDMMTPMGFFVNGETSLSEGAQESPTDDAGNLDIDYTEIVRYMNWDKR